MAGFERGSPQWGFTSYILLILFGALVYKSGPLDSDRPPHDSEGRQNFTINHIAPARLWQDPFESIVRYQKDLKLDPSVVLHHDGSEKDHPFYKENIPYPGKAFPETHSSPRPDFYHRDIPGTGSCLSKNIPVSPLAVSHNYNQ